jgi:hypothetical protein
VPDQPTDETPQEIVDRHVHAAQVRIDQVAADLRAGLAEDDRLAEDERLARQTEAGH